VIGDGELLQRLSVPIWEKRFVATCPLKLPFVSVLFVFFFAFLFFSVYLKYISKA
jgi:hypothetical protein